ncbi:MAG: prepilin-type N-terminal cleavage/methylation domain-containing protein [Pseudolysinimonas sp.]|uniref:PulJ/GspJ family protein n=1 Tax=Pseudolysinimonas sp. TaxID=2680009 RepID=UPI003C793F7D
MIALLRRLRNDDGFTLTELIASSVLFSLVTLTAVSIFLGQFSAQQQVSAITTATTDAQLAGTTIDTGIRNSSGFELTAVSADQLLVARVAGGGATLQWVCRAWYYSAADDTIRMTSTTPGTPVAAPTSSQLETWTLLADGVTPTSGTTIFSASGDLLTVSFRAETDDDNKPVAIELSSAPLAGVTENTTCY